MSSASRSRLLLIKDVATCSAPARTEVSFYPSVRAEDVSSIGLALLPFKFLFIKVLQPEPHFTPLHVS